MCFRRIQIGKGWKYLMNSNFKGSKQVLKFSWQDILVTFAKQEHIFFFLLLLVKFKITPKKRTSKLKIYVVLSYRRLLKSQFEGNFNQSLAFWHTSVWRYASYVQILGLTLFGIGGDTFIDLFTGVVGAAPPWLARPPRPMPCLDFAE